MSKTEMRPARRNEYRELLRLLDVSYVNVDFEGYWGHAINLAHVGNHHVFVKDGRLIGNFGMIPMTLLVGGVRLAGFGVGQVATHPEHRGKGVMSRLLEYADRYMRRAGALVAMLGGKRARYGRWGWEIGGQQLQFHVDRDSLEALGFTRRSGIKRLSSASEVRKWLAHSNRRAWGILRDGEWARRLLTRKGFAVYCTSGRTAFAFMVVSRKASESVLEVGGDAAAAACLLRDYLVRLGRNARLEVAHGPASDGITEMLANACTWGFRVQPSWQIKIVNLYGALRALAPVLSQRAGRTKPGAVMLHMRNSDQRTLVRWGNRVSVHKTGAAPLVRLSDMEMARLVFGTPPLDAVFSRRTLASAPLAHIFPVPWHVPRIDGV